MIWAIHDSDGYDEKVKAEPGITGNCPICGEKLIPKCGYIKVWHWSHKSNADCDLWAEPESEWHKSWKDEFPKECQEVCIIKDDIKHRADIETTNGRIIELQNSPISLKYVRQREEFYDNMIWLFNGGTFASGLNLRKKDNYVSFRWKHPPKIMWYAKKPIFIHLIGKIGQCYDSKGKFIFKIKRIYSKCPCGGWGVLLTKEEFLKEVKDGNKN